MNTTSLNIVKSIIEHNLKLEQAIDALNNLIIFKTNNQGVTEELKLEIDDFANNLRTKFLAEDSLSIEKVIKKYNAENF